MSVRKRQRSSKWQLASPRRQSIWTWKVGWNKGIALRRVVLGAQAWETRLDIYDFVIGFTHSAPFNLVETISAAACIRTEES